MQKININCPINGTGYGITSFNILKALDQQNIHLSLFPIGANMELNNEEDKILIKKCLDNSSSFSYNAPCLKIWHQHDLALKVGNGHYYSFPFFEIDTLTEREKHHLNYSEYIFVASKWAKTILQNNGINKPIYVSPLGVNMDIFYDPIKIKMEKNNYIFFHIGKWEHRKSQDMLLRAFDSAFSNEDTVELWLLPFNPFLSEEENNYWFNLVDQCKLKDKIKIFGRLPSQQHVAEFIYHGDCGVFISRAEGWNNEIIETMAMNKPVIVTDYSAHTEYCNNNNSYLVSVKETEPANDGKWFFGQGNWAKLGQNELDQTINHMKYVYSNRIDSNSDGVKTAQKYSWQNTANIINHTLTQNNSYHANTKTKRKRR